MRGGREIRIKGQEGSRESEGEGERARESERKKMQSHTDTNMQHTVL